jgi:hypothetical protein
MANSETRDAKAAANLMAGNFLEFGTKRIESFMEVQKELVDTFEQFNREQFERAKQETELASRFAGKVTSARSIPDVMAAYQEWISNRMELFAEDGRKLYEDSQKVVNATMKLLSNGKNGGLST